MLLGDELRAAIKEAYEDARAQAKAEDPPEILEPWDALPLKVRLAFVSVFGAGRRLGAKEERDRDLPPSYGSHLAGLQPLGGNDAHHHLRGAAGVPGT
jgi:hypothetical protein